MDSRMIKQILYGLFYLAIVLVVIVPFYLYVLKPVPSCSDKVQNGTEEGVDCGGACARMCLPPDLSPLSSERPKFFYPLPEKISILARVQNPNPKTGASFQYEVNILNTDGEKLKTLTGTDFLYPSQVKFILLPSLSFELKGEIARVDFVFTGVRWISDEGLSQPQIVLLDSRVVTRTDGLEVQGTILNNDIRDVKKVKLIAIFYNRFGLPTGASQTELDAMTSGESRAFSVFHPPLFSFDESRTEVMAIAEQ